MENQDKTKTGLSLSFQLIALVISISIMTLFLVIRSSYLNTREEKPVILPVTPEKFREFGGFSKIVQTGFYIQQFLDFNMIANSFTIDAILWFKFDPGAISLDTLEKFSFEKGKIEKISPANIRMIDDQLFVEYNLRLTFETALNYTDFPFDNHQINIVFFNQFIRPGEVLFESSLKAFKITADISATGWNMTDNNVTNGYIETILDVYDNRQTLTYSAIMFSMDYTRSSIRYTSSILMPLALIFYLMLFSLSTQQTTGIALTASGVTAILAYRFIIENISPKNGFFMMSDYLFFLFLGLTIAVFISNIAEEKFEIKNLYKKALLAILHAALLLSILYIFFG